MQGLRGVIPVIVCLGEFSLNFGIEVADWNGGLIQGKVLHDLEEVVAAKAILVEAVDRFYTLFKVNIIDVTVVAVIEVLSVDVTPSGEKLLSEADEG